MIHNEQDEQRRAALLRTRDWQIEDHFQTKYEARLEKLDNDNVQNMDLMKSLVASNMRIQEANKAIQNHIGTLISRVCLSKGMAETISNTFSEA